MCPTDGPGDILSFVIKTKLQYITWNVDHFTYVWVKLQKKFLQKNDWITGHINCDFIDNADILWIIKKAREFQKNVYFCFIDYAKAFDCVDHNKLWNILKEMGTPDHLTCLLRNLYASQEATVRTGHGKTDWFQIGKGICQGCIWSPHLFNLYAE